MNRRDFLKLLGVVAAAPAVLSGLAVVPPVRSQTTVGPSVQAVIPDPGPAVAITEGGSFDAADLVWEPVSGEVMWVTWVDESGAVFVERGPGR